MGTLGVLVATPNSHPSCCHRRATQYGSKPSPFFRPGQVRIGYEASSRVSLLFLSRAEWGAARAPHWERCSSLPRKKGRSRERIPSQSLHPSSRHCTTRATNLCKASLPPDPTLIPHLLRKIFKIRYGKGRRRTQRQNPSFPPLASPLCPFCASLEQPGPWGVGGG